MARRALVPAVLAACCVPWVVGGAQELQPVYVGARVCASCHSGPESGHQFSKWLLSRHAHAYADLSSPDSATITALSGIVERPQESPVCLGCHATAAEAEPWEVDDTFVLEDGVQCERCHGPGSEYMDAEVMADRKASIRAGLRIPDQRLCLVCHVEKGSHVAVHSKPQIDVDEALKTIAHPTPTEPTAGTGEGNIFAAALAAAGLSHGDIADVYEASPVGPAPGITGARACAACHESPDTGLQFSLWRVGPHARAWAVLATPEAFAAAERAGLEVPPQQAPECLRCHSTLGMLVRGEPTPDAAHGETGAGAAVLPASGVLESFSVDEGVGCEACHGAGSEYQAAAIMTDRVASERAGLRPVTEETCRSCHRSETFDFGEAYRRIAHPLRAREATVEVRRSEYKTPLNLALTPDGRELWVACEAGDSVIVVDVATREAVAEIPTGGAATDVTFHPDGTTAYVTNRIDDTVSVVDVATREVLRNVATGDEPHGVLTDATGENLFVINTSEDSISVFDTATMTEARRLRASRAPWSLALSPDGERILVTNALSRFVPFRDPPMTEVTAIDAAVGQVEGRFVAPAANIMQGVAWHPSGELALTTLNRTKNLVPMTRLLQGWTITNGLGIVWRDGRVDQVLLDEPNLSFPDPSDVAISPDGRIALATSSGSNRVAVIDVVRLVDTIRSASDQERESVLPNHLGKPTEFIVGHVPTGTSPRGVTFSHDGALAFVADALDDTITVIDIETLAPIDKIDLGGAKELSKIRRGERLFHSADIAFRRQFSCHTCHPDGHVDGITYDIEPDGLGVAPVDNRTLRGILDTAPFKWTGLNATLDRQCGPRLAVFFTRIAPFTPDQLDALTTYISTIPRPPNRYRPLGSPLTDAQRRGKAVFERKVTNGGRPIPPEGRCVNCHPPPLGTNRGKSDVGTRMPYDKDDVFDTPHLSNIYDSSPYLHNGIAETLEEIWTRFNPEDKHGVTNDLTKDQLNDLIEYIKTL